MLVWFRDGHPAAPVPDTLTDLKGSLRASLCYFRARRHKVKSIIAGRPRRKAAVGDTLSGFIYQYARQNRRC